MASENKSSSTVSMPYILKQNHLQHQANRTTPVHTSVKAESVIKRVDRITFKVLGNRVSKEFVYCVRMVQGLHKYRYKTFDTPLIRGYTSVEWPLILNELKIQHGANFSLSGQVVVLYNDKILGGEQEFKDFIEQLYIYHLDLNYPRESVLFFRNFVCSSGRPCVYMHISIDSEPIGCLIFMLYSDICSRTCENFLRLCKTRKGGYSGTPVHRIVEGGWIQCGGFGLKDSPLGCENFIVPHDRRGVLGMCNADRDVDCSTQFFVLLQPNEWMKCKYVAFGQLIEGEETLRKIANVQTYYESPMKDIIIFRAGILNLECDDIIINRGAVAYIDGHIEDLVSLGEMLYEWLLHMVDLEIQVRHFKNLALEDANNGSKATSDQDIGENKDLENDYVLKEYEGEAYGPVTPSSYEVKTSRPHYIALTDVSYPDDKDSDFDLKRFLQGDYCLEADLDQNCELPKRKQVDFRRGVSHTPYYFSQPEESPDSDTPSGADDEEFQEYVWSNLEKVSQSGTVIKKIADKSIKAYSPSETKAKLNDEELRRTRLLIQDLKTNQRYDHVSWHVSPWETHKQIKRRQTGVAGVGTFKYENVEVEEDNIDEVNDDKREVSWAARTSSVSRNFLRKEVISDEAAILAALEEEEHTPNAKDAKQKKQVRVSDEDEPRESSDFRKSSLPKKYSAKDLHKRASVLARLYEDVDIDNEASEPTLKEHGSIKRFGSPCGSRQNRIGPSSFSSRRRRRLKSKEAKRNSKTLTNSDNFKGLLTRTDRHGLLAPTHFTLSLKLGHRSSMSIGSIPEMPRVTYQASERTNKRPTLTPEQYKEKNRIYAMKMKEEHEKLLKGELTGLEKKPSSGRRPHTSDLQRNAPERQKITFKDKF